MRIAMLTTSLQGGGAARVMVNMANHWVSYGHECSLVSFEGTGSPPFYDVDDRVTLQYMGLQKSASGFVSGLMNNLGRVAGIRKHLASLRPDVVISFIHSANVLTILSMVGSGVPVIVSERIDPQFEPLGRVWETLRKIAYPLAAALVVQTDRAARYFDDWRIRGIEVIPNSVVPVVDDGKLPMLPERFVIGIGRLCEQKNFGMLIRAFASVEGRFSDWKLCIAGDGPDRESLLRLIREAGLEERVLLLGQVENVGGLLQAAGIFVLSSHYEGYPNALCEAMASGVASISTDCPSGPAEIIDDGKNGVLVPPDDEMALARAMGNLMGDDSLRRSLAEKGRDLVEVMSAEYVMRQWDCLLDAVVDRNGRGRH